MIFVIIAILILNINTAWAEEAKKNNNSFKEIAITDIENHWAKESIIRMIINGKLNGYPDKTFRPDNDISVLEFIKIMMDALDIPIVENGLNRWPDYYISTAKEYNLNYEYNKKATRYEAIEIISSLTNLENVTSVRNSFKDVDEKYKSNISKLVKLKIINGYKDGEFKGNNHLTRAEAVAMAIRVSELNHKIIENKKCEINSKYTNINVENDKIKYEIKNGKIYFFDGGRFSNVQNYTIDEKYITNKKLLNILESLISEDSYTALYYAPSKYTINQIIIKYGKNKDEINKNLEYFSITYYEDKNYNLKTATLNDIFCQDCYMKVCIKEIWKEYYEFQKGNYIDEGLKNKLYKALYNEFGKNTDEVVKYMIGKYKYFVKNKNEIVEKKEIGRFVINTYKKDSTNLEFYVGKI